MVLISRLVSGAYWMRVIPNNVGVMAEGMEVDLEEGPGPSSSGGKTKKRFEVKKVMPSVSVYALPTIFSHQWNAVALWSWGKP